MKPFNTLLLLIFCLPMGATTASAQSASLQQCQQYKDQIERYTSLRRNGGSGKQMDAWKRSRRDSEKAYSNHYCWRYRRQLQ
ncbi:MAG: hypothetical protein ABJK25_02020 [Halieaceae bacterium]